MVSLEMRFLRMFWLIVCSVKSPPVPARAVLHGGNQQCSPEAGESGSAVCLLYAGVEFSSFLDQGSS